jgi:membrane protease YdiL (CAAX protease family)
MAFLVGAIYLRTRRLFPLMITHGLLDLTLGLTILSESLQ